MSLFFKQTSCLCSILKNVTAQAGDCLFSLGRILPRQLRDFLLNYLKWGVRWENPANVCQIALIGFMSVCMKLNDISEDHTGTKTSSRYRTIEQEMTNQPRLMMVDRSAAAHRSLEGGVNCGGHVSHPSQWDIRDFKSNFVKLAGSHAESMVITAAQVNYTAALHHLYSKNDITELQLSRYWPSLKNND